MTSVFVGVWCSAAVEMLEKVAEEAERLLKPEHAQSRQYNITPQVGP